MARCALIAITLGLAASGCVAAASSQGRVVAANVLSCPVDRFETFVPHSYNLAASDTVYRGCGRDAVVRCISTPAAPAMCRPIYVSQ